MGESKKISHLARSFFIKLKNMKNLLIQIIEDVTKHFLTYFFIFVAIIYGVIFKNGVVGLVLFTLAIGILIGQKTK